MQDNEAENDTKSRACGTGMFAKIVLIVDENQMNHSPAPQSLRPALVCVNLRVGNTATASLRPRTASPDPCMYELPTEDSAVLS